MSTEKTAEKTKSTRFDSVLDMIKETTENPSHTKEFENFLATTSISRSLIQSRAKVGLTQADVAEKMGCSQSNVSKLEHSTDGEIKISEILAYLQATDGRLGIFCGKPMTIVEKIKGHVIGLRAELDKLSGIADENDDGKIRAAMNHFGEEAWYNILLVLMQATEKFRPCGENLASGSVLSVVDDSMEPVTRRRKACKCTEEAPA